VPGLFVGTDVGGGAVGAGACGAGACGPGVRTGWLVVGWVGFAIFDLSNAQPRFFASPEFTRAC